MTLPNHVSIDLPPPVAVSDVLALIERRIGGQRAIQRSVFAPTLSMVRLTPPSPIDNN